MNVAKRDVTPDLGTTYAELAEAVLRRLGVPTTSFAGTEVAERFPYLDADVAHLEPDAGVVDLEAVRLGLMRALRERGAEVLEGVDVAAVERDGDTFRAGGHTAGALVVTAGHGTNDVLAGIDGCRLQVPITKDRPTEAKYVDPPASERHRYTAGAMPVVAYLDTGVYCHPIVEGVTDAVKIGFYNPPDLPRGRTGIDSVADFVERCLPGLRGAPMRDVADYDGCDYDLVADDEFVLGPVPGIGGAFTGVGWRGTGYKFAPWVGRVLAELALQDGTVYDIARFDPARFDAGEEAGRDADAATAAR
jgi:sarcosine oxidase